jgi:predicted nuclease of restriction endonuclease-like RecB superfamily
MLTADLAIAFQRGDRIYPRRFEADEATLGVAEDLIRIVADHIHRRRADLDQALDEYVGTGTDYRILRGLIKLLMDGCQFETGGVAEPAELRRRLFLEAKAHHPITPAQHEQLIANAAEELGCAPDAILAGLYADLSDNQRLVAFDAPTADDLIAQYNLAQAQALLYRCVEMRLTVLPQETGGYRRLFSAIKRYDLIHTIKGNARAGYEVRLSGPVSLFHRSQKYGIRMAVFLPALLECEHWRMRAEIETKRGKAFFELDGAKHNLPVKQAFVWAEDGSLVEKFLSAWARLNTEWRAAVCHEVMDLSGTAFVPDVLLEDSGGRKIYVELFGFWTPRYLKERLAEFERGNFKNFVLLVSEELRGSREAPATLPPNVVSYKTSPDVRAVLAVVEQLSPP